MDGRLNQTKCDEVNVLSPRDLVSRPDNMDETVQSSRLIAGVTVSNSCHCMNVIAFKRLVIIKKKIKFVEVGFELVATNCK